VRDEEMFREASWFAVLAGQGLLPKSHHPSADLMPSDEFQWRMAKILQGTRGRSDIMPPHEAFIARTCASPALVTV
jgi:tryptophan halogenase